MTRNNAIDMQAHVSEALRYFTAMVAELTEVNKLYPMPEGTRDHLMDVSNDLARLRSELWEIYMTGKE